MYGIYRKPGFRRLDLGAWWSSGVFYGGYLNHFKNYQRKGVEFFSMPMRRLGWLKWLDFGFAIFHKGERPKAWIKLDHHRPKMSACYIIFGWFGFRFRCPFLLRKWKERQWQKEMEEMYADMPD